MNVNNETLRLARQRAARDYSDHRRACMDCHQGRYCDTVRTLDAAYRQATQAEYESWGDRIDVGS